MVVKRHSPVRGPYKGQSRTSQWRRDQEDTTDAYCVCKYHCSTLCNCKFHKEESEKDSLTCCCKYHHPDEDDSSTSSACACQYHESPECGTSDDSSFYNFSADESDISDDSPNRISCHEGNNTATQDSFLLAQQAFAENEDASTLNCSYTTVEHAHSGCTVISDIGTSSNVSLCSQGRFNDSQNVSQLQVSSDSSKSCLEGVQYAFLEPQEVDASGESEHVATDSSQDGNPSSSSESGHGWLVGSDDEDDVFNGRGGDPGGDPGDDPEDEDSNDSSNDSGGNEDGQPDEEPDGNHDSDPDSSSSSDSDAGGENFSLDNPLLDRLFTAAHNRSAREIIALVLALNYNQKLNYTTVIGICRILNVASDIEVLPGTKEQLWSLLRKKAAGLQRHAYCSECHNYLGRMSTLPRMVQCEQCDSRKPRKHIKYFITLSIKKQLIRLLSIPGIWELLQHRDNRQKLNVDAKEDVFDCEGFRALEEKEDGYRRPYDFSYFFNNDGFSVSKSSNTEAHPIFLRINEFVPSLRQKTTLLAGVWLDDKEPDFNLFFDVFVTEANTLSQEGIRWTPYGNEEIVSRFFPCAFCADAKARASVMNLNHHSGKFCCPYCEHPGVYLGGMKFPMPGTHVLVPMRNGEERLVIIPEDIPFRTDASVRADMQQATLQQRKHHGFKGVSVLMNLRHFHLAYGCSPDDLHPVYLGVTKFLTNLIIDEVDDEDAFLREIDRRLKNIRTPTLISRKPRSICRRKKWKGTEWRNWLLYFGVVCLHGHHNEPVPRIVIELFGLLSKAIFLLSQDSITDEDINEAERCLFEFATGFQNHYGSQKMRFNVHILLHLPAAVRMWGGLQIHSTFPFESLNGKFKKFIKSPKGAINQIAERYLLSSVINLLSLHPEFDDEVLEELDFILTGNKITNPVKVGNVYLFNSVGVRAPTPAERQLLGEELACEQISEYRQCRRFKVLFRVESYYDEDETKSNNSIIYSTEDEFLVTDSIVSFVHGNNNICGMFCRQVAVDIPLFGVPHIMRVTNTDERKFVPMSEVRGLAIKMQVRNRLYVTPMCNHGEID